VFGHILRREFKISRRSSHTTKSDGGIPSKNLSALSFDSDSIQLKYKIVFRFLITIQHFFNSIGIQRLPKYVPSKIIACSFAVGFGTLLDVDQMVLLCLQKVDLSLF
jgi:hypothetical protein